MFSLILRAWYKPEQSMYEVFECNFRNGTLETFELVKHRQPSNQVMKWHYNICSTEIDLMVSFGARDKNQQIIFNKDIIKHDFPDYENCSVVLGNDYPIVTHYGIVNLKVNPFDNGFYITNLIPGDHPDAPFYDEMGQNFVWNELEIIGNVYETVLFKCSHCDNMEFTADSETIGSCSICGEQSLINIDLWSTKQNNGY